MSAPGPDPKIFPTPKSPAGSLLASDSSTSTEKGYPESSSQLGIKMETDGNETRSNLVDPKTRTRSFSNNSRDTDSLTSCHQRSEKSNSSDMLLVCPNKELLKKRLAGTEANQQRSTYVPGVFLRGEMEHGVQ